MKCFVYSFNVSLKCTVLSHAMYTDTNYCINFTACIVKCSVVLYKLYCNIHCTDQTLHTPHSKVCDEYISLPGLGIVCQCVSLNRKIQHCAVLHFTVPHCTAPCCTALGCAALYCIVLYCTVLYCPLLYFTVLHRAVLHCAVLHCALCSTALCCTVM